MASLREEFGMHRQLFLKRYPSNNMICWLGQQDRSSRAFFTHFSKLKIISVQFFSQLQTSIPSLAWKMSEDRLLLKASAT
jgi:hypothetical protein